MNFSKTTLCKTVPVFLSFFLSYQAHAQWSPGPPGTKAEIDGGTVPGDALYTHIAATSGANTALNAHCLGSGADLNIAGFFYTGGGAVNQGIHIHALAAGLDNYAIYSQAAAKSYFEGNVGIGTTNPAVKLQVNGSAFSNNIGSNNFAMNSAGANYGFVINDSSDKWSLGYGTDLNSTGTSVLTWNANGKVGINRPYPLYPLDVNGRARVTSMVGPSDEELVILGYDNGDGTGRGVDFQAVQNGINFQTHNSSGWASRLFIHDDGNIGIGTTTPPSAAKLAVEGSIYARKVKVTQASWPDHVFADNYTLPSLADTERYIKANRHLPEIPSAAEVKKDGQDLGEMNRLLLQKVEEMTLHLIRQEKEIRELRSEVDQLKQ